MKKLFVLLATIIIISLIFYFELHRYVTLDYISTNRDLIYDYYHQYKYLTWGIYFAVYVVVTALSIPGAMVMTLLGGYLFGLTVGTTIISFASTIGATLAFVLSRYILQDYVERSFPNQLSSINDGIKKEGAFYLLTLRLIPIIPFFAINLGMGLTKIRLITFYLVSQIGMIPGTIAYVNAGKELGKIDSVRGLVSPSLLLSFAIIGIIPLVSKKLIDATRKRKIYKKYKRPKSYQYNSVVIGGGSAGLVTSYISAILKSRVALIERSEMGGDCLNTGCVPSKALIRAAKAIDPILMKDELGIKTVNIEYDFKKVMERVQSVVKKVAPHDSIERYTELGVDCIQGEAKIISPWEVLVNDKIITTKNIIIATGASPFVPPFSGIDEVEYVTSDTIWSTRQLPRKFIVIGGGPIGVELAQCFARFGSNVTILQGLDRLINREDPETSAVLERQFEEEGIDIICDATIKHFKRENSVQKLYFESNGKECELDFDLVLVATGRRANTKGFGAEELGIELRKNGTFEANHFLQTNFPNIYVCGDVTGPYQLTHTAGHQGWYAAVNSLFQGLAKFKVDYKVIPWCTYTHPEVATVGLNELMAKEKGVKYEVTTFKLEELDRAIADRDTKGHIKVLTRPGKDEIIGATIVSDHASTMILEFITAMKWKLGLNKIMQTIHIYPSMGEGNKYVAGEWKRKRIPHKLLSYVEKYHSWRRG